MYICRLGIVAFLLSDCLVSGLTTGAAFHIISAQMKDFVGVKIPLIGAHFKIIKVSHCTVDADDNVITMFTHPLTLDIHRDL